MSEPLVIESGCACGAWFVLDTDQDWFTRGVFETWKNAHFGLLENGPHHRQVPPAKAREIAELDATIRSSPTLSLALQAEEARRERLRRWNGSGPLQAPLEVAP